MSLIDSNIQNYKILLPQKTISKYWSVQDYQRNNLGKIKLGWGELGTCKLLDSDNSVILTSKKKITIKPTFEIKDSSNERIGLVKKLGLVKKNDKILMEDKIGKIIFKTKIPSGPDVSEKIYDNEEKEIAKISTERRSAFGLYDETFDWRLDLINGSSNRLQLWGLFVSILNMNRPTYWAIPENVSN